MKFTRNYDSRVIIYERKIVYKMGHRFKPVFKQVCEGVPNAFSLDSSMIKANAATMAGNIDTLCAGDYVSIPGNEDRQDNIFWLRWSFSFILQLSRALLKAHLRLCRFRGGWLCCCRKKNSYLCIDSVHCEIRRLLCLV